MHGIVPELHLWMKKEQEFALATVVRTWGSSPRGVGAKMAVNQDGEIIGSVSGGCVEGAVISECLQTIQSGQPKLLHFHVADHTAWEVGLACGGELDIFIHKPSTAFLHASDRAWNSQQTLLTASIIDGNPDRLGKESLFIGAEMIGGNLNPELSVEIQQILTSPPSKPTPFLLSTGDTVFIDINEPLPTLIIVGGVHIAVSLTQIAKACNYQVIIVDPRRQFATKLRFPEANLVLNLWPDKAFEQIELTSNTAVVFLTHDPKIDDPGLIAALSSPVFYIGALGSRKTQEERRVRLLDFGVTKDALDRLHGPIGLDLGGRNPEDIALSVMAEITKTRHSTRS